MTDVVLLTQTVDGVEFKVTITTDDRSKNLLTIDDEDFRIWERDVLDVIKAIANSDTFDEVIGGFKDIWWDNFITQHMEEMI